MNIEAKTDQPARSATRPPPSFQLAEKNNAQMIAVFVSVVLVTTVWVGVLIFLGLEIVQRLKG